MNENETREFKKSTSELKEAIISIAAILNKHGKGELYFGVNRDGEVIGQFVTENTIREISQTISNNIEPKIFPRINEITLEGKKGVLVEFTGNNAPYYARGRAYMRVGDEDRKMSAGEIERIILEKNKDKLAWDKEACKEAKLTDISAQKIKSFLRKAGLKFDTVENALRKLGLISGQKLRNAAVILFAKKPELFFPNAKLRCALFGTTDASVTIDMHDYQGDLFSLIEKAEDYILDHINIGMRLEGLYRVDVPEIDKEAFREAIINAFCHRDYHLYDSVNIAIFKDRLEIRSPGLLYGGLTIEKIKAGGVSERRNELLAEMFHQIHFVEKWGRGIGLILSKEPDANFKEIGRQFVVTFKRKASIPTVPEEIAFKSTRKIPEKYQKIINAIKENPHISRKELALKLGETEETVQSRLRKLVKEQMLEHIGPDKGGHWAVK